MVSGCGAAAQSCIKFYFSLGVDPQNVIMSDKYGVLYEGRKEGIDETLTPFLRKTDKRTLADILEDADVFLGLSVGNIVTADMLQKMAPQPLIFALANPTPEISYTEAHLARPDAIVATGRSDFPNQVNNVLGFPFIFRGALDTQAHCINEEMKIAAARAIANLAKEEVPDSVVKAYSHTQFRFGSDYIIPKPFDPRVLLWVAPAVAEAATKTGVAKKPLEDPSFTVNNLKNVLTMLVARFIWFTIAPKTLTSHWCSLRPTMTSSCKQRASVYKKGSLNQFCSAKKKPFAMQCRNITLTYRMFASLTRASKENHKAFIYAYFAMRQRKRRDSDRSGTCVSVKRLLRSYDGKVRARRRTYCWCHSRLPQRHQTHFGMH